MCFKVSNAIQPGPVGELIMEGPRQVVSFLLDWRILIPRASLLFCGPSLSFLAPQLDFLQLLLLPLLLQAPQGA